MMERCSQTRRAPFAGQRSSTMRIGVPEEIKVLE